MDAVEQPIHCTLSQKTGQAIIPHNSRKCTRRPILIILLVSHSQMNCREAEVNLPPPLKSVAAVPCES